MAGIKISELPATSLIYEDDSLILSRGDSTRKIAGRHFATTLITNQLSTNNANLTRTTTNTFNSLSSRTFATINTLSSDTFTVINSLSSSTFATINTLSSDTFTVINSLSSAVSAKKRWIDFLS